MPQPPAGECPFPLLNMLDAIAWQPGTTDLTLKSSGTAAVRQNMRLSVAPMPGIREWWAEIVAFAFPNRPKDTRQGYTTILRASEERRYRITLTREQGGESIAIRPLPQRIKEPKELHLPEHILEYFQRLKGGLFLIGGPTGSGKSTTQATFLRSLSERARSGGGKIVCIEDPVEFKHQDTENTIFHQRQLGDEVLTYGDGLKEALHQNPDVISVQEIREGSAAVTALSAALSGHLVVGSIHAFTAATAPQRYLSIINPSMEDLGAQDALASCLEGVIIQRLVPGFDGLVPIMEVMLMRDYRTMERMTRMENAIRRGQWLGLRQEIEAGEHYGMFTMDTHRKQRVSDGLIPE